MNDTSEKVRVGQGPAERTQTGATRSPFVDIFETGDGLTVVAEMPGVAAEDVNVQVEKGVLTIAGGGVASGPEGFQPIYEGIPASGGFFRAFALSDEIDRERATAKMKDGVLTVTLPKAEQAKTRKIPVQAGP